MRKLIFLLALVAAPALAHPGVGIVADSRGNLYYTDLKHVWRLGTDGKTTIVVPNVHTHELAIDAQDNLYGEHSWYEGERIDKWGFYVWRRSADGKVAIVIPRTEGFRDDHDYSFVRDRAGTMYWGDRDAGIIKKRIGNRVVQHARLPKGDLRWMTATPDGTLLFVSSGVLYRVGPNGTVTTLANDLASRTLLALGKIDRHSVMGLWTDNAGNVYLADHANDRVLRVTPNGALSVVEEGKPTWKVTGGTFARDGWMWVLEYRGNFEARARKIGKVPAR